MPYYVYVLLCGNGSYYTGYAKDIEKRFKQHKRGNGARYTKMHRPEKLVYIAEFNTRREAIRREKRIKRLSHDEKQKLVVSHSCAITNEGIYSPKRK